MSLTRLWSWQDMVSSCSLTSSKLAPSFLALNCMAKLVKKSNIGKFLKKINLNFLFGENTIRVAQTSRPYCTGMEMRITQQGDR